MNPSFLIFGYYGRQNMGDEIILAVLVERLRRMWPGCRILVFCHEDESNIKRLGVEKAIDPDTALKQCDVLIVGGGGLFHDVGPTAWESQWYIHLLIRRARLKKKKVALLGVGIGPLHTARGRLAMTLNGWLSHLITVRDPDSALLLKKLLVPSRKVHLTADLAFLYQSQPGRGSKHALIASIEKMPRPWLGMNIFGKVSLNSEGLPVHHFTSTQDDIVRRQIFAEALDHVLDKTGGSVIFLASQGCFDGNDFEEAASVISLMKNRGRCMNIPYQQELSLYPQVLKCFDALVSMKLHPLILGYMAGLPVLGIFYQSKVKGFLKSIGSNAWLSIGDLAVQRLVEGILDLLNGPHQQSARNSPLSLQRLAEGNFKLLEKLVSL